MYIYSLCVISSYCWYY